MNNIVNYLDCGNIFINNPRESVDYYVEKFSDLTEKIIPFFENYPIIGVKNLDFKDFCSVSSLMKEKKHLTALWLKKIRGIKENMNKDRRS